MSNRSKFVSPPGSLLTGNVPPMGDEDFRLFRDFIQAGSGIYFSESSRPVLEKRIFRLLNARRLRNYRDYYYYLKYDARKEEELDQVIDAVTTNETYFFREERQLKAFREEILPELHARKLAGGTRRLHIWSAGCSSGEEPYSLAMIIIESKLFHDWQVDIFASDINRRILHAARKGVYGKSSFRVTEQSVIDRHFKETEGRWRINDEIRKYVNFSHLNLIDQAKINLLGTMDVIFCRNVIIYFDLETKKAIVRSLADKLAPGGYLMLGHSESLINITPAFELKHLKNDLVYQKPRKKSVFSRAPKPQGA